MVRRDRPGEARGAAARGDPGVVPDLAADVRRPGRPDRGHAARARRRAPLDRRAPVPARAELLHAAARPGGPAARDLQRLAAQRLGRRRHRRRAVRAAGLHGASWRCPGCTSRTASRRWSRGCCSAWRPRWSRSSSRRSLRLGGRALRNRVLLGLAVAAFLRWRCWRLPFPLVVLGAGLTGWLIGRRRPDLVRLPEPAQPRTRRRRWSPTTRCTGPAVGPPQPVVLAVGLVALGRPGRRSPCALARRARDSVFTDQGAVLRRHGAGDVRRRVRRAVVRRAGGGRHYGWLTAGEMVRGLALAETTPGPLIMVVQFVAFLGAYRDPGGLDPWVGRGARLAAGRVGDVRAVLPLHLPRRAVRRAAARQRAAGGRAHGRHRRGRRRDRQPGGLLRRAHALRRAQRSAWSTSALLVPVWSSLRVGASSSSGAGAGARVRAAAGRCCARWASARSLGLALSLVDLRACRPGNVSIGPVVLMTEPSRRMPTSGSTRAARSPGSPHAGSSRWRRSATSTSPGTS